MTTATKKVSELSAAGTLAGSELVPVVQGGSSKRATTAAIANTASNINAIIGATTPAAATFTTVTPTAGIVAAGGFTLSPRTCNSGDISATQTSDGNDTTPSVTETYFCEIFIPGNVTVTGIANFNGSAVGSDKWIVILWNSSGSVVANSALAGTTASGTTAFQLVPFTAPYAAVGPATYYVGLQCNGTTARFRTHLLGVFGAGKATSTTFGTPPTITPATTFTANQGPIMTLY